MIAKKSSAELVARLVIGLIAFVLGFNWFRDLILVLPIGGLTETLVSGLITSHYVLLVSAVHLVATAVQIIVGALLLIHHFVPLPMALLAVVTVNILVDQLNELDGPFQVSSCVVARRKTSQRTLAAKPLREVADFAEQCARFWRPSIERLEVYLRELQFPTIEWSQLK